MKSLHSVHGAMMLAAASLLVAGCAHQEVPAPKAPETAEVPETTSTTTTTSAAMPAQPATSEVHVSNELMRACNLHFSDISQTPKFDFDNSNLKPDDDNVLTQIAQCVTTGPLQGRALKLVGRADPRGETEYNFSLGEHRAASVQHYLNALGVSPAQVQTTSRGKLDATGTNEASWQVDRRVDIELQ